MHEKRYTETVFFREEAKVERRKGILVSTYKIDYIICDEML
jgi:hypothetical protein